ncbi:MAG: hypothetical protein WAV93_13495, partial [Bacteroidales bacterium]
MIQIICDVGGNVTDVDESLAAFPVGVDGVFDDLTDTYTISGTPSVSGSFPYYLSTACTTGSSSTSGTITVNNYLTVNVIIAASANPVCPGASVTFTASPTNGGATPIYQWTVNSAPVGDNNEVYSYIPANGDIVAVTLTSSATCTSGNPATSIPITISQYDPLLPGTINTTTSQFCLGGTETIGGHSAPYGPATGGSGNYTYYWQIDQGCDGGWADLPGDTDFESYAPPAPTTIGSFCYRRRVHDNICNTDEYTLEKRFEIYSDLISQEIVPSPSGPSVCEGTSVSATFTGGSGGPPSLYIDIYEYSINGGSWISYTPGTPISTNDVDEVEIRTRRQASGVDGCNYGDYESVSWTVISTTPTSVSISTSATTICEGAQVTFSATPTNGGSSPSYQWQISIDGGTSYADIAGENASTYVTTTLGNGNRVRVEMISNAICPTPIPAVSNFYTITVNPAVEPSISIEASETEFCEGTSVVFTALIPTNGGLNPSYQWYVDSTPVGNNSNTFTSSSLADDQTVTVHLTSSAACATPQTVISNPIQVSVNPNLPVSVSIAESANNVCAGTSVTFTATPTHGGTTPSYQWRVNGAVVGSDSPTYNYTPATGDQVYVVMTSNAAPCATGNPATSNTVTMTVNPNLPVSVSITASTNPVCDDASVTFTATPTNGGTSPGYQWYVGGNPVGTNSPTYTYSPAPGDLVHVVLTSNAAPCATGTPAISNTVTMTVNPNLPVSVSIAESANPVCASTSVTFTATPTNGGTAPAYQWYLNGGLVGSNSATYSYVPTNNDQVYVVLTSNATCATGSPATSNTVSMTVNPNLPVSVSVASSANPVCAGTSVTFTASPINGGTTPVYQWYRNAAAVGTNSSTYSYIPANGDQVYVVLTSNADPCATGNPATSNTVTMTVNPNLPVSVTVAPSANPVCAGASVTFTATPTNGGSTPAYQWYVNGSPVGSNSVTYSYVPVQGDKVYVVLTSNADPCATGNPATSNTVTMAVNPNLPVSVTIAPSSNPVCAGTSVTFTATPTNGGTTPAYQWYRNAVAVGTNSATYSYIPATGDQVYVVLTSNATCATGSPATSNTVSMTVNPNLPVSVSVASSANPVCAGTLVTFTASPINGGTTPAYNWYLNGSPVGTNSATYSYVPATGDLVYVVLTSNATPCPTGNPATSNTVTMTVNPLVVPAVSIGATATSVCNNTSVTFTATPVNGGANPLYQWQINGVNQGAPTTSNTFTRATWVNGQIVSVVLTSNATCRSPVTATSNNIPMVVYTGPPSLPNNQISGPTAVCPPADVTYTVVPLTGSTGATYYDWTFPTGWVINSGQGTITVNATATGSAVIGNNQDIRVTVSNPCGTGNYRTFRVDVNTFAAINLGSDFSMCAGTSVTLNPVLTGNANTIVSFTPSSGIISGGPYPAPYTYTPSITSGSVTLNATTNDPAGSCNAGTDQLIITVNQPVAITLQPVATQTLCSGANVSFSVSATGTDLSYQWRKGAVNLVNGGNISGATTATLTLTGINPADAGIYSVV